MQNNQSIERFYDEVFEDFKNRLFIAYRFKSTISSQQIDKFTKPKIVKDKMHRKRDMFDTGIRFSLQKRSKQQQQKHDLGLTREHSKVKVEHLQQDDNYYIHGQKPISEQDNQQSSNSQSEDVDDLEQFNKSKKPIVDQVKKEEPQEKQQVKDGSDSEEMYEVQDRQKAQILAKTPKKIAAHIIATYNTKNKKHIPKDQKTKIDLENVFIRTGQREVFYTKIQCQFQQAQYSNIKL